MHTPTEGLPGEMCKSIEVGKTVHVAIHLGLPVGELDAVIEVLQQQMYLKACTENWKKNY